MSRAVLITGGARGIGLAVARQFDAAGDRVGVTYRSTAPPDDIFAVHCDVTDEGSVTAALAAFEAEHGPVEVLVSNAGVTLDKLSLRMTDDEFRGVVDTNLTSAFRLSRLVSRNMIRARWGRIVFISSMMAYLGAPGQVNYAASKAGLTGLARSLAWELGSRNITVNVVAPGLIETEMSSAITAVRREQLIGMTALGRAGAPDDVAHLVQFLARDEANFITGAVVPVSGGCAMGY